jgi:NAD(P)H-dependent flavin oxidoreductase YrpB (nitropropane dioxygenase family)
MLKFDTEFCRLVGVPLPIVQAPIGGLATPEVAAAASEAGALGMLAMTWTEPDEIDAILGRMAALTAKPFGVNLILRTEQEERLRRSLDGGARIISFFWGDPAPLVPIAHAAGALVMHTVGSAAEARRVVDAGVDIVVAQGVEAGGHVWGDVATLPLIPAVVDAVAPTPVVAAGGIGDGRGLAAVLALGASAGWLGTRFVLTTEVQAHPRYREMLLEATETDTFHSSLFDGGWPDAPHRTLRNSTIEAWETAGRPPPGARPGEDDTLATDRAGEPVKRYQSTSPRAELDGEIEALSLWAGQSVGLVNDIRPVRDVVASIAAEAAAALGIAVARVSDEGPI